MAPSVAEGTPIKSSSFSLPETRSFINLSSDTFTGSRLIKGTWDPRSILTIKHFYNRHSLLAHIKFHFRPSKGKTSGHRWSNRLPVGLFETNLLPACDIICLTKVVKPCAWMSFVLPGRKTFSLLINDTVTCQLLGCFFFVTGAFIKPAVHSHTYHNDERARPEVWSPASPASPLPFTARSVLPIIL